jgi:peptide/nickel transport system substrate-binding protein
MSTDGNYWSRRTVSRRTALRGAGVGVAGLAGAALIGCGGDDDDEVAATGESQFGAATQQQQQATAAATGAASSNQPVPPDQVRIAPGIYDAPIPPTPAEANPMVNAVRGGTATYRYLDPPRMDINRTLSCTIYHTMDYTNSKLVRGKTGSTAHPFVVEIEPDLAESWEASPDNTEFTFHLRQGVKTHNVDPTFGREFTSEDVKLSIERYQAGGTQKDVYAPVTAIDTPDDYTIKFTLDQPLADFPINVSSWSFLWPRELIENDDLLQERAVGTGAFVQDEWTKKERSVFSAHPDYFEEGLPFLDKVVVVVQNDTATNRAAFLTGDFWGWGARDDDDMEDMAGNTQDSGVFWRYPRSRGANVNGWHFQMTNPVFQDERVRRAISLAFDRNEFDLADNAGDNQNPNGAFSNPPMPWSFLFDEYPDARANGPWYQFDPAQATQLLDAAGYTADNPLKWEHVTWYDRTDSGEVIIPGINEALGGVVDISFRQVDNPTQVTLLSDRNFDESIGIVWGPPGHSMDQWIFPWWHSQGGLNYNNVNDAEIDGLLESQRAETDLEAKKVIWQQVWDRIHDQVWDIWWPEALSRTAWHNWIINHRPHALMGGWVCYTSNQTRAMWLAEDSPHGR